MTASGSIAIMSDIVTSNSQVQPPEKPSSSHDFGRLPAELHHMIWDMAIQDEPRIIKVEPPTSSLPRETLGRLRLHAIASCTIPILLCMTKESRSRALELYRLPFSENLG